MPGKLVISPNTWESVKFPNSYFLQKYNHVTSLISIKRLLNKLLNNLKKSSSLFLSILSKIVTTLILKKNVIKKYF